MHPKLALLSIIAIVPLVATIPLLRKYGYCQRLKFWHKVVTVPGEQNERDDVRLDDRGRRGTAPVADLVVNTTSSTADPDGILPAESNMPSLSHSVSTLATGTNSGPVTPDGSSPTTSFPEYNEALAQRLLAANRAVNDGVPPVVEENDRGISRL